MRYLAIFVLVVLAFAFGYSKGYEAEYEYTDEDELIDAMLDVIDEVETNNTKYFNDTLVKTKVYQTYDSIWASYNL